MVCQICHDEMPFKKRDGQHYFEAVEILDNLPIEHQALYIALCPVCAAKYREFVKTDDGAMRALANGLKQAAKPEVELRLGQDRARLCFVETHLLDLKTLLTELVYPAT